MSSLVSINGWGGVEISSCNSGFEMELDLAGPSQGQTPVSLASHL